MVKNLWGRVRLYCGCHEEEVELLPNERGMSLFFFCPKYDKKNRNSDEKPCRNRISVETYESIVNHLGEELLKNEEENVVASLEGLSWEKRGIFCKVIEDSGNLIEPIKVEVINLPALKY